MSAQDVVVRLRAFLDAHRLPEERRAIADAALDAFLAYDAHPDPSVLDPIVLAMRVTNKPVHETASQLLYALATTSEPARARWCELASDKATGVRFLAVAYVDVDLPEATRLEVVRRGLSDPSSRVRAKAVEVADRIGARTLVGELSAMQSSEQDRKVRLALDYYLPMLRDGWVLESTDETSHRVRFRVPGALISSPLFGEATEERIRALIAEESRLHGRR